MMHPSRRRDLPALDPEFLTIYFMRGSHLDRKVALRRVWVIFAGLLVAFGLVGLRVWQEMQVVKAGYVLQRLRTERARLMEEQQVLLTRRNVMANLSRVESVARTALDLKPPSQDQVVFILEPARSKPGLAGVWSASQSWMGSLAVKWKTWLGLGQEQEKEARLGG